MQKRVTVAREHRDLFPPSFNFREFEQDFETTAALLECAKVADQIREKIDDTLLVVGKRAQASSSNAWGHLTLGAKSVDRLKKTVEPTAIRSNRRALKDQNPVLIALPRKPKKTPLLVDRTDRREGA